MNFIQLRKLYALLITLSIVFSFSITASAEHYQGQTSTQANNTYITVFEDCGFRGKSRSLAVGEYSDVRKLNLRNDSISSIQVPSGLQISLFEDERFRGSTITINSSLDCLNSAWDDKTSSMRVSKSYQAQVYTSPSSAQQRFTTKVSRVWFANISLEKMTGSQWRIVNQNGSVDIFREVRRDGRVIYLQNNRINQSVQIDMYAKNVQFLAAYGKPVNYAIIRSELEKANYNNPVNTNVASTRNPSRRIKNRCFNFRATAYGGEGGIRFHGKKAIDHFGKNGRSGKICHDGKLTMEINKRQAPTKVVVEIEGNKYVFAAHEKADLFQNNWYRKIVKLRVGSN